MAELSFEGLQRIAGSKWSRKTLVAAVELEVFNKIKQGFDTAEKIAESLNTKTKGVERLLNACVALGFIEKEEEQYKNTQLSERFLVKESPDYYGDFIIMTDKITERWDSLTENILKGETPKEQSTNFEDPLFTRAMHNNSLGPAKVLAEKLDFSKYNNLLDLGGGSGAFSIELTNKCPNLKATVYELENVCKTVEEYIEKLGNPEKVKTKIGDFLTDELPEGYDIVLLSQILHSHSINDCKKLIKKIYDILPNDGLIIINDFLLNPDKTGPVFPVLFSITMFLASSEGSAYTKEEITSWLKEGNFKDIEIIPLIGPHTAIIAKK